MDFRLSSLTTIAHQPVICVTSNHCDKRISEVLSILMDAAEVMGLEKTLCKCYIMQRQLELLCLRQTDVC